METRPASMKSLSLACFISAMWPEVDAARLAIANVLVGRGCPPLLLKIVESIMTNAISML